MFLSVVIFQMGQKGLENKFETPYAQFINFTICIFMKYIFMMDPSNVTWKTNVSLLTVIQNKSTAKTVDYRNHIIYFKKQNMLENREFKTN